MNKFRINGIFICNLGSILEGTGPKDAASSLEVVGPRGTGGSPEGTAAVEGNLAVGTAAMGNPEDTVGKLLVAGDTRILVAASMAAEGILANLVVPLQLSHLVVVNLDSHLVGELVDIQPMGIPLVVGRVPQGVLPGLHLEPCHLVQCT